MKITDMLHDEGNCTVSMWNKDNPNGTRVVVDMSYMTKHEPAIGGYYVEYDDGYKSFSPCETFESGYTPQLES